VLVDLHNGATPNWSGEEAQKLGFKIAICPAATQGPAFGTMMEALESL